MFIDSKSYADDCRCVKSLKDKCEIVRAGLALDIEDVRVQTLGVIEQKCQCSMVVLNLLDSWVIGDRKIKSIIPQLIGVRADDGNYEPLIHRLAKDTKLNLVVGIQFHIENLFSTLNTELGNDGVRGFKRNTTKLLSKLGMNSDLITELMVPAFIRNSLHNNGLHNEQSVALVIDGVEYSFERDRHLGCSSRPHIAHALENTITIIESILSQPSVVGLGGPILDKASREKSSAR